MHGQHTHDDLSRLPMTSLAASIAFVPQGTRINFADRAEGEAWLQQQDALDLLHKAEAIREIGLTGWRQLRATVAPESNDVHLATSGAASFKSFVPPAANTTAGLVGAAATISTNVPRVMAGRVAGDAENGTRSDRRRPNGKNHDTLQEVAGHKTSGKEESTGEVPIPNLVTARSPSRAPAPTSFTFTFFHMFGTDEIRWSLSPRSALKTPPTPRREAYRAKITANIVANNPSDSFGTGAVTGIVSGDSVLSGKASRGTGWELVEDGNVVFYYNRNIGISSWEPPVGWEDDVVFRSGQLSDNLDESALPSSD